MIIHSLIKIFQNFKKTLELVIEIFDGYEILRLIITVNTASKRKFK